MTVERVLQPGRRPSITAAVGIELSGNVHKVLITFGLDENKRVRETFCSSFKEGAALQSFIVDASILLSLLLQHGYTAAELAAKMTEPPSMIGQVARAAADMEKELNS